MLNVKRVVLKCVLFSGPIDDVNKTRIFVARVDKDMQLTVYSNSVSTSTLKSKPSAMILPVPNGITRMVDMSDKPNFLQLLMKHYTTFQELQ